MVRAMMRTRSRFVPLALASSLAAACSSSAPPAATTPAPPEAPPATTEAAAAPAAPAADRPAAAKVEEVVEEIHGAKVRDPYRWMEKGGPAFDAFLDEQDGVARKALAGIAGREQLKAAISAANQGVTRVAVRGVRGSLTKPRVFLSKRAPTDDTAQLYVRDGWDGADRILVDPRARKEGDRHFSIDYVQASPDGKHVAYGISASGSEDSVVEILEVDTGKVRPEKIDRAQYAGIRWRDNRSFFYWRRRAPEPTDTRADWFKNSASYLHVLGDDPDRARPVISPTMKELGLAVESFTWIEPSPRSKWVLAAATPGTSADTEYFVAPLAKVAPDKTPWRRISGPNDHVTSIEARGDTLYALSYDQAPRYRILAIDAKAGTLATAKVFVPESDAVLEGFVTADDAMYVQYFDGGKTRVERITYDGKKREVVKLPFDGTTYIGGDADRPGIRFFSQGWVQSASDYLYEPKAGIRKLALREPWPKDYSQALEAELVEVKASDGALVPLSIVRRKDLVRDGSAPAWLDGYQSYGNLEVPYFAPISLTWVERGAVYAQCHGRGTSNRGKQWHLDGVKHHKERGVDDFLACAEYLVAQKYTAAARLTVSGTSSGGVLVGGAITKRPELFTAAVLRVPVVNLSRFESTAGGPANVPEYGTLTIAEDARHLLASDPYQRLTPGTRYPAILLTAGKHDVRVPAWLPAKFAARAQAVNGGDRPIYLRVEREAGHGIGSTRTQTEEEWADLFAFALWQSGVAVGK